MTVLCYEFRQGSGKVSFKLLLEWIASFDCRSASEHSNQQPREGRRYIRSRASDHWIPNVSEMVSRHYGHVDFAQTRVGKPPSLSVHITAPLMEVWRMLRKKTVKNIPARFQVEIMREELDEMERLRELGGLGSKKELLNNALTLLKWAVRQKERGYSIASIDENGEIYRELELPYLESVGLKSHRSPQAVPTAAMEVDNDRSSSEPVASKVTAVQLAGSSARSR